MVEKDLVARYQKLQEKKRDFEIKEAQIETRLQSLQERREQLLEKLSNDYGIFSFEELKQRVEEEKSKLDESLTQAEIKVSEIL